MTTPAISEVAPENLLGRNWYSSVVRTFLAEAESADPATDKEVVERVAEKLGIDLPVALGLCTVLTATAKDYLAAAEDERSGLPQGQRRQSSGYAGCADIVGVLRRMALTMEAPEAEEEPTRWIDRGAPFELAQATVAVRNALVESPFGSVETCCWEASAALGLRARHLGYEAEWQSCNATGWFHMMIRCGRWLFDPTAEQYGVAGPQIFELSGERPWPIIGLDPDATAVGLLELPKAPPLHEGALVDRLADWVRKGQNGHWLDWTHGPDTAIPSLLRATHLDHLIDAVYEVAGSCPPRRSA